jgi:N utilization substance protein B
MQSIFAYEQCKVANYHLALEDIVEAFLPDLTSMEVQDKKLLKESGKEAENLFKQLYKSNPSKVKEGPTDKINEVVEVAIKQYYERLDKDAKFLKREMLKDAEQINDRYSWLIHLLGPLKEVLKSIKTKGRVSSFDNIQDNTVIDALIKNPKLERTFIKSGLSWDGQREELVVWINEVILKDEEVVHYLELNRPGFKDDKEFLLHFYKALIFKAEIIGLYMEQVDLYWSENKAILRSMVVKTIKAVEEGDEDFEPAELSYNWEEDKEFFELLFDKTTEEEEKYEEMIAARTKNWDIDRISDTDKILLQMAIQEMINFPGIPLKVTINEYIEVSKKYSTPKSKLFINGVLDVIAVDLQKDGVIRKSGRGLIDNK